MKVPISLTIRQFVELSNRILREGLHIHPKFDLEIVETNSDKGEYADAIFPNHIQTLEQRYGNLSPSVSFYARPVDKETRVFQRDINYYV